MRRTALLAVAICLALSSAPAFGQTIIYDNASTLPGSGQNGLVTNPGAGFGGGDLSAITAPDVIAGFSANSAGPFRIADNFTVPAGQIWTINAVHVFSYTTGGTVPSVSAGTLQFFLGSPAAGGTVVGGDTTTNVLTSNVFAGPNPNGIWRAVSTSPLTNNRRIQDDTLTLATPLILPAGQYWMDYGLTFTGGAGFNPPMSTTAGGNVTGDALQLVGTTYTPIIDNNAGAGSQMPKGMPFTLFGTATPVPEPTSIALVGLVGAAGFGWRRWRTK